MAEKEYIEREAAINRLFEAIPYHFALQTGLERAINYLRAIPAADVRPVVLCRDCKRYGGRPWENNESGICARTDVGVGEFDFCSYGEKREKS